MFVLLKKESVGVEGATWAERRGNATHTTQHHKSGGTMN